MLKRRRSDIVKVLPREELEKVWPRYVKDRNLQDEGILVRNYWAWLISLADSTKKKYHLTVEFDDLVAEGSVGLLSALRKFEPDQSDKGIDAFVLYAYLRVRGKMIDCQEGWTGIPRLVRRNLALYEKAKSDLHGKDGVTEQKIREEAGLTDQNVDRIRSAVKWSSKQAISPTPDFDTPIFDSHRTPDQIGEDNDFALSLLKRLDANSRHMLIRSIFYGETKKIIGKGIGLTESAACLRYNKALKEARRLIDIERREVNANIARYVENFNKSQDGGIGRHSGK